MALYFYIFKGGIMRLVKILAIAVSVAFFATACKKEKDGTVNTVVSVTETTVASSLTGLNLLALGKDERVSFTPSSMKITAKSVSINESMTTDGVFANTAGREAGTDINKEVELIGQEAFSALASGQNDSVGKDSFGDFLGSKFLHNGIVKVSGELTVAGVDYSFSDLDVQLNGTGIAVGLTGPVTLDENNTPTLRVLFDVEDALYLQQDAPNPNRGLIPDTDIYVVAENINFIPYAGNDTPTFEKYEVRVDGDDFGDSNLFYLRISILKNAAGAVVGGVWNSIYAYGFNSPSWEPLPLNSNLITKNADGTYILCSYTNVPERLLLFEKFELGSHSGTFALGSKVYNYTATAL